MKNSTHFCFTLSWVQNKHPKLQQLIQQRICSEASLAHTTLNTEQQSPMEKKAFLQCCKMD